MSITSMIFLFVFLPVSLAVYYISADRAKEYVLLALSLIFYSLGSPDYLVLFVAAILVTVLCGRLMASFRGKPAGSFLMILGIIFNAGLLVYYKYTNLAFIVPGRVSDTDLTARSLILPLGISFFTFKAISYLCDIRSGKAVLSENPLHDALYLSFFPQIQSGPLARYNEMEPLRPESKVTSAGTVSSENRLSMFRLQLFSEGVFRFAAGFSKKVLIANILANITNEVYAAPFDSLSTSYAWLGAVCYSLQLYFDFSGYSDMAIGLTQMFGYSCRENFYYPYMTESVSKFWRRWHISLSEWFRDYIYIPMGGSRVGGKGRVYFNLFVVWLLTGIWHGASLNYVIWGLGFFILISFERLTGLPGRIKTGWGRALYRIFTLLFINFEWVLFRAGSLHQGLVHIKRMLLFRPNELSDLRTVFLLKDYAFFIIVGILLCFPIVPWLDRKLAEKKVLHTVFEAVVLILTAGAFLWAVSFIVAGQNNPFAYANF